MAYKHRKENNNNRILTLGNVEFEEVNDVIKSIYIINHEDKDKELPKREPIKLIINSPGGDVYSGLGLIDVIEHSETPIYTICHGAALSMAMVVFAAGHVRYSSKYATFMYHEANYGLEGKVIYHKQEVKEAERTDKLCDDYLLTRTKFTMKQFNDIRERQKEWYIDATTAKKYGLVDEILE